MAGHQMKFVKRDELKNMTEGNVVVGVTLAGSHVNVTERFVATVNGLVSLQDGDAGVTGCFYPYAMVEAQKRFRLVSFVDAGPAEDWRAPTEEEAAKQAAKAEAKSLTTEERREARLSARVATSQESEPAILPPQAIIQSAP